MTSAKKSTVRPDWASSLSNEITTGLEPPFKNGFFRRIRATDDKTKDPDILAGMTKITEKQADHILTCADLEGFDYCFRSYSSFKEVTDPEFRKLVVAYKDAAQKLEDYLRAAAPDHEES